MYKLFYVPKKTIEQDLPSYKDLGNKYSDYLINLMGLHHDLYQVEGRQHRFNFWLTPSWDNILGNMAKENIVIIGIAPSPTVSGTTLNPVGLVYERKDTGDYEWCHIDKNWIETMRQQTKEEYNNISI